MFQIHKPRNQDDVFCILMSEAGTWTYIFEGRARLLEEKASHRDSSNPGYSFQETRDWNPWVKMKKKKWKGIGANWMGLRGHRCCQDVLCIYVGVWDPARREFPLKGRSFLLFERLFIEKGSSSLSSTYCLQYLYIYAKYLNGSWCLFFLFIFNYI